MPRIIAALVRHGDYHQRENTPSAHQPYPLTEKGQQQANEAANELVAVAAKNDWNINSNIDSSTLLRAWQTAQCYQRSIQHNLNKHVDVTSFDSLCERSVGSAANLSLTEINSLIGDDPRVATLPENWKSDSYFRLPLVGAESLMAAGERVAEHIRSSVTQIDDYSKDQLKIFVGHGAAFRHAAYLLGVLSFEDIAKYSMHHARPVYIEQVASGQWQHIGGDWKRRDKTTLLLD